MVLDKKNKANDQSQALRSYIILFIFTVLTLLATYLLYIQLQEYFKSRLQERLIAIVSTASVNFEAEELKKITGPKSIGTNMYENVIYKLNEIRNKNKNLKFIYILRKTEDPNTLVFVADADSLDPSAEIDLNGDGHIDDSDVLNTPGDEYDVSEFPDLRDSGFAVPTIDDELAIDQWGTFLSATAPISDEQGFANELLGIDVEVSDYKKITNLVFIPFALFVAFLLFVLSLQTILLVGLWNARLDLLKELDRQKDELLGIVSHQLATPISALKWDFEMLLDGDIGEVKEEQKDFFQKLQGVTAHLSDLVSMILDVSRIQLGRMKVDRTELDLNNFFGDVQNIMQAKAKEHKVDLSASIQEKMGVRNLDKRLMLMITENLLSNAIKYTPEGGKVSLNAGVEQGMLKFSVSDTGCGIPKQDQDKIFCKLFRASNVRNVDGNGFGLYVVKGAVEAQNGKISFISKEKEGTTFIVELPLPTNAS